MLIHTINKSPFSHLSLEKCLTFCRQEDAIVLLEDGVYAVNHPLISESISCSLYAIDSDVAARGLEIAYRNQNATQNKIQTINYEEFVALCVEYQKQKNW